MWDCSARRRLESFDLAENFGHEIREINQSISEFLVILSRRSLRLAKGEYLQGGNDDVMFIIGQEKMGAVNLVQMLCSVYV
ncbi:unnamed protein product [Sphagnum troendelagicum]|uniref:Uncharacterized protein n=1 Tax=Sphagnum troendelagicum TaxID=128251 RepID=A0ABP0TNL1_9BRYO